METKLQQIEVDANLPAGIFNGIEAFWAKGEKWLLYEGQVKRFNEAAAKIQNMVANEFLKDERSRAILSKAGVTKFKQAFDLWYRCVIGALDNVPDFINGEFTPDFYNTSCKDYKCPYRGKLCSLQSNLSNTEVRTILALKKGNTIEITAKELFLSKAGVKSRIEKIKNKLKTKNMASMMAKASELGI